VALNPTLDVSQYAHTAWRSREGFTKGGVHAIAQTPDGFLWLGTDFGLVRFDGVRTSQWQPPQGEALPHSMIRDLLVARDGGLWIATSQGLARWSHGELVTYPQFQGWFVNGLLQDRQGTVWASGNLLEGRCQVCAMRSDRTDCYGSDGTFGAWATTMAEDRDGNLWIATAKGLWRWQPGTPQLYSLPDAVLGNLHSLSTLPTGGMLVLTTKGAERIVEGGKASLYWALPATGLHANAVFTDRDGAVWIGTDQGLSHLHNARMDEFGQSDGLSGDNVGSLFEDREGNVWVATTEGIDRFHALPVTVYSARVGVLGWDASVLADRNAGVWFTTDLGVYRWKENRLLVYRGHHEESHREPQRPIDSDVVHEVVVPGLPDSPEASLFQDHTGKLWLGTRSALGYLEQDRFVSIVGVPPGYIDSIVEDRDGKLWVAHRAAGLLEISSNRVVQQIPWVTLSQNGPATRLSVDSVQGGLWLGFFSGGLVHVTGGQVRASYGSRDGLGKGRVNQVRMASDGAVWVATEGGLSRLKGGRIATLTTKDGLPCDNIDSSIEDDGSLWAYTACGLVRIARSDLQSWSDAADRAQSGRSKIPLTVLDDSDGVGSFSSISTFSPHIARTADGRLWLANPSGLSVVNPHDAHVNALPPPVHVERIIADRVPYEGHSRLRLPPLLRDLEIDYTALSLVAPEKVQFRYMLEGRDRSWQDAGNRRSAFYTDLPPGNYRFHVIASNNSAVWNTQGAAVDFTVTPAYWQTNWFRALSAAVALAIAWGLYQSRLRQLRRGFQVTLDARVNERTRIARELHDTLLQSLQGLLMRFQSVANLLPEGSTKQKLESAIDEGAEAITEGRDVIQQLRSSTVESGDLAVTLNILGEQLATIQTQDHKPSFVVQVQGSRRAIRPIVQDDIYRISAEALRNAFLHAEAQHIDVELHYGDRQLRVRVRDDGKGIDLKVAGAGYRPGHFGMHGMQERSQVLGARLEVWSELNSGTEVELTVPAAAAYGSTRARSRFWRFGGLAWRRTA
jgi:signal transduction histidine kinase/ligand-binding sensor domain-containing protein